MIIKTGCSAVRLAHLLWEQGSQVRILVPRQKKEKTIVFSFFFYYHHTTLSPTYSKDNARIKIYCISNHTFHFPFFVFRNKTNNMNKFGKLFFAATLSCFAM